MFTRGDETSFKLMMGEFQKFSDSTGLKANPAKCKVYFGRHEMRWCFLNSA
jgi:hypothetical protein